MSPLDHLSVGRRSLPLRSQVGNVGVDDSTQAPIIYDPASVGSTCILSIGTKTYIPASTMVTMRRSRYQIPNLHDLF
jgi:hypothetical protein